MTIQLYRVPDGSIEKPTDVCYVSRDGKIHVSFHEEYPLLKDMPAFMDVSFFWDELPLACQAFLFFLYEKWIGKRTQ
jgi:hypothetical protein